MTLKASVDRNWLFEHKRPTKAQTVAPPGLNLVNVAQCVFYITILPIIAISEILPCENDVQFIIHCAKSQRRLHLIEFVLYFLAGCLLAMWGGGTLSGHFRDVWAEGRWDTPFYAQKRLNLKSKPTSCS